MVALGLSVGAAAALVAGMVATARPQATAVPVVDAVEEDDGGPVAAEPAETPFADRPAITQSGAS